MQSAPAERQYVWGIRGLDDLVLRDRCTGSDPTVLGERLYALQDDNFNVTALVDSDGNMQERFIYDPYGRFEVFDGSDLPRLISSFDWDILYAGYRFDHETGLYHVRRRQFSPLLGRWLQTDPAGYEDSYNLYQYRQSSPVSYVDPTGNYVESLWDLASLSLGAWSFKENISEGNYGWAALDAAGIVADAFALALPIAPGGAGAAIKALRAGGLAIDAAKSVRRIEHGIDAVSDVVKLADLGANAIQSYDAYQRGDYLGAVIGGVHVGVRGIQTGFVVGRRAFRTELRWDRRFIYDPRPFKGKPWQRAEDFVSNDYWRGRAKGRELHHWLIPQELKFVPEGFRNAGFNLLVIPSWPRIKKLNLNAWMGLSSRWRWRSHWRHKLAAITLVNTIRVGIPGSIAGSAYLGYLVGDAIYSSAAND